MPLGRQDIDLRESLGKVRDGGIPTRAVLRLAEEAGPNRRLFTTDLTVNELLVTAEIGCEHVSQVMGTSVYHIARVPDYKGKTGELEAISYGHREARRRALHRLWQEAQLVSADAVVGVRLGERWITKGAHGKGGDDGDEIIEFTIVGTAVRAPFLREIPNRPIVTDLSGQDLWALSREGYLPVGLVFDFCRYHVFHVLSARSSGAGEIQDAEIAVEYAREVVLGRVAAQAGMLGAELVVGSDVTIKAREVPCGFEGCSSNDFEVDVALFGTAIRRMASAPPPSPHVPPLVLGMIPLGKKRKKDIVEEEDESDELRREAEEEEKEAANE